MTKIAIIGLGYVGLPLALEFGKIFNTVGFDISKARIKSLKSGLDLNLEHKKSEILRAKKLTFSSNEARLKTCNIFIITVPTPVLDSKKPDLSFLESATNLVAKYLKQNDLVIFESSVYPNCTDDFCLPLLEKSGLKLNVNFGVGFSPERINPSNYKKSNSKLTDIVKIVSGSNEYYLNLIASLYKKIIPAGIFKAKSIKVAEAAKMLENIQRDINIAFMNEMSVFFKEININTQDVLEACKTKWNFIPFQPGLVGGHCICVNPYYMLSEAKRVNLDLALTKKAREINEGMGEVVVQNIIKALNQKSIDKSPQILIIGATYKKNCKDIRNSFIFEIKEKLEKQISAKISVCDNLIANSKLDKDLNNQKLCDFSRLKDCKKSKFDAIIILSLHNKLKKELKTKKINRVKIEDLLKTNGVVYDIFNSLKKIKLLKPLNLFNL